MAKNITRDLAIGSIAEKQIAKIYEEIGFKSEFNTENNKLYDLVSWNTRTRFTTEVKYDIYAKKSGNVAIETFNPKQGKESGISCTAATLWAHVIEDAFITSVKLLKEFIHVTKPFRIIEAGGDDNATLFLYKRELILDSIFYNLTSLSKAKRKSTILKLIKED